MLIPFIAIVTFSTILGCCIGEYKRQKDISSNFSEDISKSTKEEKSNEILTNVLKRTKSIITDDRKCDKCGNWYKEYCSTMFDNHCRCSFSKQQWKGTFDYKTMFE